MILMIIDFILFFIYIFTYLFTLIFSYLQTTDRPLEGFSVNYENDNYKILKFLNKSKFTFIRD